MTYEVANGRTSSSALSYSPAASTGGAWQDCAVGIEGPKAMRSQRVVILLLASACGGRGADASKAPSGNDASGAGDAASDGASLLDGTMPVDGTMPRDVAKPNDGDVDASVLGCSQRDQVPASLSCDTPCTSLNAGAVCMPIDCLHNPQQYPRSLCLCDQGIWQCPSCRTAAACSACGPQPGHLCSDQDPPECYSSELPSRPPNYCGCKPLPFYVDGAAVPADASAFTEAGIILPEGASLKPAWICNDAWPTPDYCPLTPLDSSPSCAVGTPCYYRVGTMGAGLSDPNVTCECQPSHGLMCTAEQLPVGGPAISPASACAGFARGVPFWRATGNGAVGNALSQRCICSVGADARWQCDAPMACPSNPPLRRSCRKCRAAKMAELFPRFWQSG